MELGGDPKWLDEDGGTTEGGDLTEASHVEFDDGSAVLASRAMWRPFGEPRKPEHTGATYKVDLAPAEDEYLLWDEPFE